MFDIQFMKKTYLFSLLLLVSCTANNPIIIEEKIPYYADITEAKYSDTPQPLSDFVDSIEYIRLSEDILLPDIRRFQIEVDDSDSIFLSGGSGVYKFTPQGKYLGNLIKKGQGPGEIPSLVLYCFFNMRDRYFSVQSYGKNTYTKLSFDGTYLGDDVRYNASMNLYEKSILSYWEGTEIYHYVRTSPYKIHDKINMDSLYFFRVKDLSTNQTIFKLRNWHSDSKGEITGQRAITNSLGFDFGVDYDSIFWIRPVHLDTIYYSKKINEYSPLYIVHQPEDAANYDWLAKLDAGIGNYSKKEILNTRQLWSTFVLPSGLLYDFGSPNEGGTGFCPKNGKGVYYSKEFKNDVDDHFLKLDFSYRINNRGITEHNGYLYLLINAFEFFNEGCNPPFPDLTEESNPVVVKLKLKR